MPLLLSPEQIFPCPSRPVDICYLVSGPTKTHAWNVIRKSKGCRWCQFKSDSVLPSSSGISRLSNNSSQVPRLKSESNNRTQSPFGVHLKSEKALPVRLTVLSQGPTSDVYFARQLVNMSDLIASKKNISSCSLPTGHDCRHCRRILVSSPEEYDSRLRHRVVVVTEVKNQNKLLFIFKRKESELKPKMVDVDLPLMLSLSPEPDSPVPITLSAKSTTKGSLFNEIKLTKVEV
uniref:Uncharacterized protein n=1 Tax=Daphnia galeata TaxID=27404 RepID=A0A8J2S0T6_9CRUS|nr:unnamed protein product [Daphnia galeata]